MFVRFGRVFRSVAPAAQDRSAGRRARDDGRTESFCLRFRFPSKGEGERRWARRTTRRSDRAELTSGLRGIRRYSGSERAHAKPSRSSPPFLAFGKSEALWRVRLF